MSFKFDGSMAGGLRLKVWKFWGLVSNFREVTGEKLLGRHFALPLLPSRIRLSWFKLKFFFKQYRFFNKNNLFFDFRITITNKFTVARKVKDNDILIIKKLTSSCFFYLKVGENILQK